MPGGYAQWEAVFPLLAREWTSGRGELHGIVKACVVVTRRIGGCYIAAISTPVLPLVS